ncbi:MAG: SurA N-terminal domain-containing protein [Pseudomonadota bacterium]
MLNMFRSSGKSKGMSIVVWILLGLLIIGLTGFGLGGAVSGLAGASVARVGGQTVETEDFIRQLDRQRNAFAQSTGQAVTMSQAQLFGLDQQVLSQMITRAALDDQVADMGVSVGDQIVRDQLSGSGQFQGVDGSFDQTSYEFFLRQSGLTPSQFEDQLRRDAARTLLEVAVAGGVEMPDLFAETLLIQLAEERSFSLVRLTPALLAEPIPEPTEAELRAFYDENPDLFTTAETRVVSYASMSPDQMADTIEVTDAQVQDLYNARADAYDQPERRIVDVLGFGSEADAQEALDQINAGAQSFDDLVSARGLENRDITLGPITRDSLGANARDVVFGAAEPGVFGPVQSDLGPSLYRVNAILAAQTRSLDDVSNELRAELASDAAIDAVLDLIDPVQDLLAAGATLEEVAQETGLGFGEIGLTAVPADSGLGADLTFRAEAFEAEVGEERDLVELDNGGIAAVRVERVDPPMLRPYEDETAAIRENWAAAARAAALAEQAATLKAQLDEGRQFASVAEGLERRDFGPVNRNGAIDPDLPPELLSRVFELDQSASAVIEDLDGAVLVQVTGVTAFDPDAAENADRVEALKTELNSSLSSTLFQAYAQQLVDATSVSINQQLITDTLALYP